MSETPANPFASPEIEEIAAYTGPAHQTKTLGRWIGLSALSGVLLFAAYFVAAIALCVLGTVLTMSPGSIFDAEFLTALGIYCAIGGTYGVVIGLIVGITFGTITYQSAVGRGATTLYWFGLPFAVLMTVLLPAGFLLFLLFQLSDANRMLWIWTVVLGLFGLIAAAHLAHNIRRFLIKPLAEAERESLAT